MKYSFSKLSKEQQKCIKDALIRLFSENPYESVSVSNIAAACKLTPAQYKTILSSKKKAFHIAAEEAFSVRLDYLKNIATCSEGLSFFDLLGQVYIGALTFFEEYPLHHRMLINLLKSMPEKCEFFDKIRPSSDAFYLRLLDRGIKENAVNPNIDLQFTAYMISSFHLHFFDYMTLHNISSRQELLGYGYKILSFIENGIRSR